MCSVLAVGCSGVVRVADGSQLEILSPRLQLVLPVVADTATDRQHCFVCQGQLSVVVELFDDLVLCKWLGKE